jgi:hypothetical protein
MKANGHIKWPLPASHISSAMTRGKRIQLSFQFMDIAASSFKRIASGAAENFAAGKRIDP